MRVFDKEQRQSGWQPTSAQLNDWLKEQVLCTVSTVDSNGAPESATVAFSVTKGGDYIIGTSQSSRKSRNIDKDSRVALVVTDSAKRYTVQIKGAAKKLTETMFQDNFSKEHYDQRPESLPFKDAPGQVHILIKPEVIRFSDCSVNPWLVTELINDSKETEA